jgi:periplasmic mercuric ion binding protein
VVSCDDVNDLGFFDPWRQAMRLSKGFVAAAACGLLVMSGSATAPAETKVTVKGVHLCCGSCVKGVAAALKGVEGVRPSCDQKAGTVTLTAQSDEAAQRALDALGAAGYFGDTRDAKLAIKPASPAKGKVKSLTLTGVHNCCGKCCGAIKAAVKTVDGVKSDTAKPKADAFEVTGDFEPSAVLDALNAAGFNATIK